ncbi:carboxylesterase/lipase family protein [Cytobacillus purgationiresistens]|uniref:Carboxylic ester hydrolase n=1 Tax=Cytobacillus purgationiresistens TaxID=863449 RepID=A0ABU0AKX3_9BACI|nr:carboxylesterase/lipase family protein [Cytobacillus purgationiresistens]MDQ0271903.1 para-nitrobenzyl esterase [Cytobacillus purgationiresistens]
MENTLVQTKQGQLKGLVEREVRVWKGIPFAKSPIGDLRFQPPKAPEEWEGTRDATEYGSVCPQNREIAERLGTPVDQMSEDCLYLNVWTPLKSEEKRPVMVWIHGGAFRSGSGSTPLYNGAKLAQEGDVVVVTLNYRLGPLGFLHLAGMDESYTANLGLLDQIAALTWVKENISSFGGDPEQVTIFGESAGSMSIASLLTMPAAKGLFHKAIMQSGASQIISPQKASDIARSVLTELGIGINQLYKLGALSTEAIIKAGEVIGQKYGADGMMLFQPTLDEKTLPLYPTAAIANGYAKDIPLLIGTNHDEGHFFFDEETPLTPASTREAVLVKQVGEEHAQELKALYPETLDGAAQFMTDFIFWKPAIEFATAQAQFAPVWMYRFDWIEPNHPQLGKAVHALEIPFIFNNLGYFKSLHVTVNEEMQGLAAQMQSAWIAFATSSDPNVDALGQQWPTYDSSKRSTFIFNRQLSLSQDPYSEKRGLLQI